MIRAPMLLALMALLVLAGCGGGGKSGLGSVTKDDLAIMVLPAGEIGSAASGLAVDPASGFQTTADAASDTLDPADTAADIEAAGLQADYELNYVTAPSSTKPRQVSSEVALFGSADEASAFVTAKVGDAEQHEGIALPNGVQVTSVDVTQIDGPGDVAYRGVATAPYRGGEITTTVVAFSKDRIAGSVAVATFGTPSTVPELDALALALDRRISAVAKGELSETPVPVPNR